MTGNPSNTYYKKVPVEAVQIGNAEITANGGFDGDLFVAPHGSLEWLKDAMLKKEKITLVSHGADYYQWDVLSSYSGSNINGLREMGLEKKRVGPGDWIVMNRPNDFSAYTNEEFQKIFTKA